MTLRWPSAASSAAILRRLRRSPVLGLADAAAWPLPRPSAAPRGATCGPRPCRWRACGTLLLDHSNKFGFEGVVSKHLAPRYAGGPSGNWVKTKYPGWKRINARTFLLGMKPFHRTAPLKHYGPVIAPHSVGNSLASTGVDALPVLAKSERVSDTVFPEADEAEPHHCRLYPQQMTRRVHSASRAVNDPPLIAAAASTPCRSAAGTRRGIPPRPQSPMWGQRRRT